MAKNLSVSSVQYVRVALFLFSQKIVLCIWYYSHTPDTYFACQKIGWQRKCKREYENKKTYLITRIAWNDCCLSFVSVSVTFREKKELDFFSWSNWKQQYWYQPRAPPHHHRMPKEQVNFKSLCIFLTEFQMQLEKCLMCSMQTYCEMAFYRNNFAFQYKRDVCHCFGQLKFILRYWKFIKLNFSLCWLEHFSRPSINWISWVKRFRKI